MVRVSDRSCVTENPVYTVTQPEQKKILKFFKFKPLIGDWMVKTKTNRMVVAVNFYHFKLLANPNYNREISIVRGANYFTVFVS